MNRSSTDRVLRSLLPVLLLAVALPAMGQVDPRLVINPWTEGEHWAETMDDLLFINDGQDKRSDEDIDIFYWNSEGRVRFDRADPDPRFYLGYQILTMDINSEIPDFVTGLTDIAITGAFVLSDDADNRWTLMAGAGTANDNHFSNTDAIYAIGNLNYTKKVDANTALQLGLNYDGNRSFLPDVPIPYIAWQKKGETFSYSLGAPNSSFVWQVCEPFVLRGSYTFPDYMMGSAEYWFNEEWSVFGMYQRSVDPFFLHDVENRRVFYELSRVEVGGRMKKSWLDLSAGVGLAFDQEFSTGWDTRDLDTVAEPTDEPYLFLRIQGTF